MSNFILNTSFHIKKKYVPQFIDWARNTYIPQALNSGLFSNPLFTHLLIEVEPDTDSFAIHLNTKDIEKAVEWHDSTAAALKEKLHLDTDKSALYFTTYMQEL